MMSKQPIKWSFGVVDALSGPVKRMAASFTPMIEAAKKADREFSVLQKNTEGFRKKIGAIGGSIKDAGGKMTLGLTAPIAALEVASVKTFADFEQGVVNVVKTTGLGFGEVEGAIGKLTKELQVIPVDNLLEIAGAAGQLGVKGVENISLFTGTMAKLEKATDIAGEDGAKAIVRLLNVAGEGIPQIEQFGSTIVALGNNSAASESEILEVATRVGQATAQFKLGSKNILGLSAGMKSLGITAEAGGTVIGKAFLEIANAVDKGGNQMKVLQKITGMSGDTIKKTFKQDANQVFISFLQGLGRLEKKGISNTRALEAFGLSGDRVNAILPTMVQGIETVTGAMKIAGDAFSENKALQEEFAVQTQTANSLFAKFGNIMKMAAISVGKILFPAVEVLLNGLGALVEWFTNLGKPMQAIIVITATLVAAVGPMLIIFGTILTMIPQMVTGFALLKVGLAALGVTSWAALLPLIKFIAIAALLGTAAVMVYKQWEPIKEFFSDLFTDPMSQIIDMIGYVGELTGLFSKFGFGGADETDKKLMDQGFKINGAGPQGDPIGAKKIIKKDNEFMQRQQKAQIDVNFSNLPKGTRVESDDRGSIMNLNTGMMGAL